MATLVSAQRLDARRKARAVAVDALEQIITCHLHPGPADAGQRSFLGELRRIRNLLEAYARRQDKTEVPW